AEVRADVRAALRATGATAVLVTHDQEEALGMADLVAVLRDGVIAQVGTAQQVYDEPTDLDVALFVGEAVLLDVPARQGTAGSWLGEVPLAAQNGPEQNGSAPQHAGVAVLRPEQLFLTVAGEDVGQALVRDVIFHGHDATVMLEPIEVHGGPGVLSDGGHLRARVQGHLHVRPGDRVHIDVHGAARFYPTPTPAALGVPARTTTLDQIRS
ncbi:MAG: ABC transporter ATP-binding protein, partial [Haloechinothrix sp.]